jgi:cell wall-associated NlpC family hydrolase
MRNRVLAAIGMAASALTTTLGGLAGLAVAQGAPAASAQTVHATVAAGSSNPSPVYGNPYWLASADGGVWPLGGAPAFGSALGVRLASPVVGVTATADKKGYWLVAGDGGVFSYGDAHFYGSTGNVRLTKPIIGITTTPDGKGYWLYASDGGIFTFGDAHFYGSTGNVRLTKPIVGMAATADGKGYWMVASDGGIFTFGDAGFHGSTGATRLAEPVVAMTATNDGGGYWLTASDGGVFNFGDATFAGSMWGAGRVMAALVADPNGSGYWEIGHDGDVYPFGSAAGHSVPTIALFHSILGPGDVAMEWAMAQIGKPYQWGGTGPNSFDCSGLVMRAWQAAGVTLPRVANNQYYGGTNVPFNALQIGDLVFWATNTAQPSTIYHVAMYIGGDHIVEAPYAGQLVQTNWAGGGDFVPEGTRP